MLFEKPVENAHFELIPLRLLFLLADVISEGATGHGKCDDAGEHDENTNDLLLKGLGRKITISYRRDRSDREVK